VTEEGRRKFATHAALAIAEYSSSDSNPIATAGHDAPLAETFEQAGEGRTRRDL